MFLVWFVLRAWAACGAASGGKYLLQDVNSIKVQGSRFIYFTLFTLNKHRKKSIVTQNYKIKIITVRVLKMCMVVKVARAF